MIKGFGAFTINSSIRKMISSTLVADYYARNSKDSNKTAILDMTNIIELNLVTAIQIATMTAIIVASSVTSAGAAAAAAS